MDPRRSALAVIVFLACVVAIWFFMGVGLTSLDSFREQKESPVPSVLESPKVTVLHHTEDGMHHYSGSVDMPTPCHSLSSSLEVRGQEATIILKTQAPEEGVVCAQVIDPQAFTVSLSADEAPRVSLTLDGKETELTVLEQ